MNHVLFEDELIDVLISEESLYDIFTFCMIQSKFHRYMLQTKYEIYPKRLSKSQKDELYLHQWQALFYQVKAIKIRRRIINENKGADNGLTQTI